MAQGSSTSEINFETRDTASSGAERPSRRDAIGDWIGLGVLDEKALWIGSYEILARIGQGASGSIYKARQLRMDRLVALKILPPRQAARVRVREAFFREARSIARLDHPNIVRGIDVGTAGGIPYFAMEYVKGASLNELIKCCGAFDERTALGIVAQVARALQHLHVHQIVHRDVKPDNILLTGDGVAKLCDLGLARVLDADEPAEEPAGKLLGTPWYISPEQATGQADVDIRSDIYSLGASLYHMVVGEPPFTDCSVREIVEAHVHRPVPRLRPRNGAVSIPVERLCLRMMAKEREFRQQDPEELLADLERVVAGLPAARPAPARAASSALARRIRRIRRFR